MPNTDPMLLVARWYPDVPPALPGETDVTYTNRLLGTDRTPYDHDRYRQCSLGYHTECSANGSRHGSCECPHHDEPLLGGPMHPGAERLAELYYLPDGTADRVMRIAAEVVRGAANPEHEVASAISREYDSPIGKSFAIDVVSILRNHSEVFR